MNKKDASIIKVLTDLGLRDEPELTPEEEEMFIQATHPEEKFLAGVLKVFNSDQSD